MSDRVVPLGTLVSITRGNTYKSALLGQPGPVLLGLASISRNGGFRADSLRTYGGDSPVRLLVKPGELFASLKDVTQSADLLGAVARVPVDGPVGRLTQDTVRLDVISDDVDAEYLYRTLLTAEYREYCRQHSTGTTNLGLPREDFLAYPVRLPSLKEQRDVAGLLRIFDSLIDRDSRIINDLLDTAKVAHSLVRADGQATTFGNVVDVHGGGTPSTREPSYWGGEVHWATPTDLTKLPSPYLFSTSRTLTNEGLAACSSSVHPAGSILMTSRATIGAFAVAQVPTAVNQGFIVVTPNTEAETTFLLLEMMSRVPEFIQQANGTTFLELSRSKFKNLPVIWPHEDQLQRLHRQASPLLAAGAALQQEIGELMRTRDELLPLLVSGRVRVRDVEGLVA